MVPVIFGLRFQGHQFPTSNPRKSAFIRFHTDGESVAFNQSAEAAHQGFMHSAPHRAIILSPEYNAVGLGAVERDGTLWITEDFARLR